MSQDCLEDFLAVASELRVGGIGFDSRKDNDEDNLNSRQKKTVFGIDQGVANPSLDDRQDRGSTKLQSNWDPYIEEGLDYDNLQNMSLRQRWDAGQLGKNDQSHGYSETLDEANVMHDSGEMFYTDKEEKGEIQKKAAKKKRHYDYMRDPIRVKANDRTGKVNTKTFVFVYFCISQR